MIISLMLLSSIFQSFYDISLDDVLSCTLLCDKVLWMLTIAILHEPNCQLSLVGHEWNKWITPNTVQVLTVIVKAELNPINGVWPPKDVFRVLYTTKSNQMIILNILISFPYHMAHIISNYIDENSIDVNLQLKQEIIARTAVLIFVKRLFNSSCRSTVALCQLNWHSCIGTAGFIGSSIWPFAA